MTNDQITQPRPTIHHMKVWPQFFPSLEDGSKTFEARKDDRGFRVGDVLRLCGWDSGSSTYLNWSQERTITYKLSGPAWGVESGYCILGLSPLARHAQLAATEKERDEITAKLAEAERDCERLRTMASICASCGSVILTGSGVCPCVSEAMAERERLFLHAAGFPNKPDWVGEHLQAWIKNKDAKADNSSKIAHKALDDLFALQTSIADLSHPNILMLLEERNQLRARCASLESLLRECAKKLFHPHDADVASDNWLVGRIEALLAGPL